MLTLYGHPFSSYCQKVLTALYESNTPFDFQHVDLGDPQAAADLARLWPFRKFPVLVDDDATIVESSIIIEHLDTRYPDRERLIPDDPASALNVRFLDRFFDNYIHAPMQAIVSDTLHGKNDRDVVATACQTLDTAYAWLEDWLSGRVWASDEHFTLADCSAAPALFYADWTHAIGDEFPNVRAYRSRLNARPSVARAIEEARPFRAYFPLGAPDRD